MKITRSFVVYPVILYYKNFMAHALVVWFFSYLYFISLKKKSNLFTTIIVQVHVDILNEVKQENIFIWKGQGSYFG